MKGLQKINKKKYDVDSLGNKFKTPVCIRAKKSKFYKLLLELSDEELKALGYCLLVSSKVKDAIDCFSQTVEHGAQLYALEMEYNKRVNK